MPSFMNKALAYLGLKDLDEDEELEYTIVDVTSADPATDPPRISYTSPVGQALIQKKKGDRVKVVLPNGEMQFEILSLRHAGPE